jgi:hypothetical protein
LWLTMMFYELYTNSFLYTERRFYSIAQMDRLSFWFGVICLTTSDPV